MHLLSSHRLSPHHPSIHLPSQWLPLFPSTHYFLFIPLMSQIQIWASLIEHTPLDTAALFEKTAISGCEELGKGNKSTMWLFSKAAGDCKMQKQRETCRLKKTCMNASEKACVVLLPCLIPVARSQPCLPGHYCWVYFCYLLSFPWRRNSWPLISLPGRGCDKTSQTWRCLRNTYAYKGSHTWLSAEFCGTRWEDLLAQSHKHVLVFQWQNQKKNTVSVWKV